MRILGLPCASIRASRSILFLSLIRPRAAVLSFCSATDSADSISKGDWKRVIRSSLCSLITSIRVLGVSKFSTVSTLSWSFQAWALPRRNSHRKSRRYHFTREQAVLTRLKQGEIVALISDACTLGISDPGTQLVKICVKENIDVIPIHGACVVVAALSASGLDTDEFTFVGFLPKHSGTRKKRLLVSSNETRTQIFYVPSHKLSQFLEETTPYFGESRQCAIAREITKLHEEFWRGSLGEAKQEFHILQPKREITLLIERKEETKAENQTEPQLEEELRGLISDEHSLSLAVRIVAERTSMRMKEACSLALNKFGKQIQVEEDAKE